MGSLPGTAARGSVRTAGGDNRFLSSRLMPVNGQHIKYKKTTQNTKQNKSFYALVQDDAQELRTA